MSLKGPIDRTAIVRDIAQKMNVSEEQVALAVDSQFLLVAKTLKEGIFRSIRLPFFGQWKVKPARLEFIRQSAAKSTKGRRPKTDQDISLYVASTDSDASSG